MLKWEREGTGYDIGYSLYNPNGLKMAEAYRGGHRDYPWSWHLLDGSKQHGTTTSLREAKSQAERAILGTLTRHE